MSELLDWNSFDEASKPKYDKDDRVKANCLYLKGGNTYKVRPLGRVKAVWKFWNDTVAGKRFAIVDDPDTCPIQEKYGLQPSVRYCINVIDRADGKVKIMEGPKTVFEGFSAWYRNSGSDPSSSAEGADFAIEVQKTTGANGKAMTKYLVSAIKQTPLTPEEKVLAKADMVNLNDFYKPHTLEEMENLLFPKADAGSSPKDNSAKTDDYDGVSSNESAIVDDEDIPF